MILLALGLVLFLGVHSVRIAADDWRTRFVRQRGEGPWKAAVSVLSALGLVLIVLGFRATRQDPVVLWVPPLALRHLAGTLVLLAFVFLAAAYVPGNSIRSRLHHPMVLAVKTWALGHLLANGRAADVLLFGAFLAWAVVDFSSARRRDRAAGVTYPPGRPGPTLATIVIGLVVGIVFALWGHAALFGVSPFAMPSASTTAA